MRYLHGFADSAKSYGERLRGCNFRNMNAEKAESLSPELQVALEPLLNVIESLSERIQEYNEAIDRLAAESYPQVVLLKQIKGVGTLIALTFLLSLEDPHRYRKSRDVGGYHNMPSTDFFLDKRKPSYIGGILEMANGRLYPFWNNLTTALRTGLPRNEVRDGSPNPFAAIYAEPARLKEFLKSMSGISHAANLAIARSFLGANTTRLWMSGTGKRMLVRKAYDALPDGGAYIVSQSIIDKVLRPADANASTVKALQQRA